MSAVTIKDIAEAANVSYSTVSRALNHKYGVNSATRERVLEVARRLRYSPNAVAQGLVNRRTATIGLVLPDVTNPFFPEIAAGVELAAEQLDMGVFLCNTNWAEEREHKYLDLLARRRVDGIIISPISDAAERTADAELADTPVVYVSNAPKPTRHRFVIIDDVRGGYIATRHLLDQGYESVGFIGAVSGSVTVSDRLEGYRRALLEANRPFDEGLVRLSDFRQKTGYDVVRSLVKEGRCPRAVFAENDIIALGVLQGARELGVRVPEELAVIGFDDVPMAGFDDVALSTVRQPKREMGQLAVELLMEEIERIEGKASGDRKGESACDRGAGTILEPELVVRRTSVCG